METRTLFYRLTLSARAKRVMMCAVACGALVSGALASAQPTSEPAAAANHDARNSRRNVTGSAQMSSSKNETTGSLPDAPSAVQRNSPTVGLPAPVERFSEGAPALTDPQSVAGTASAESAQPESEPLEWEDSHQGCARPKGLALARHILGDTLQVGTANYDGGTIVFYVQIPRRLTAPPCGAAHQR